MSNNKINLNKKPKFVISANESEQVTANFDTWAKKYFNFDNTNVKIERNKVLENYNDQAGSNKLLPGIFKKKLDLWCNSMGFVLNPAKQCNAELDKNTGQKTRIIHCRDKMVNGKEKYTCFEMLYIGTNEQ